MSRYKPKSECTDAEWEAYLQKHRDYSEANRQRRRDIALRHRWRNIEEVRSKDRARAHRNYHLKKESRDGKAK